MTTAEQMAEHIAEHLGVLAGEIGERPGGSKGGAAAITYLEGVLADSGWAVETQWFPMPAWVDGGSHLTLDGATLAAATNAFSPPVEARGAVLAAGTWAELAAAELNGRIVLLYGDLLPAPLSPKSWFLISEEEQALIAILEQQHPAALLTAQRFGGGLERLIEDAEFTIPSATISAEAARDILRQPGLEVDLRIASNIGAGQTANVVARAGTGSGRVVLCAHHDTKFGTPGALDNAAGTAVILALAAALNPAAYPFALELIVFANEEYMPIGDDEYLRRAGGSVDGVLACINIDGAGLVTAPDSMTVLSAGDELEAALRALAAADPAIVWADPWPESNHSTFAMRGVPSVAFTSAERTSLAHHPEDTIIWVDAARLARVAGLATAVLEVL